MGKSKNKNPSQLTKAEWTRFFQLMDKIVHSDILSYRDIGADILDAASKNDDEGFTDVWLETFVAIFDGSLDGDVGLQLDLEAADDKAENDMALEEAEDDCYEEDDE